MPYRYLKRINDTGYFHVYNRGTNKKTIFYSATDNIRFLEAVERISQEVGVGVLAYCLMRNHYHLLLEESAVGQIAMMTQRINGGYAKYFNYKYSQTGHLFGGPYGERAVMDDADLLSVSAYIHNNPYTTGADTEAYRWSSMGDYLSGVSSWINKAPILSVFTETNKVAAYQEYVATSRSLVSTQETKPGIEVAMV